MSDIVYRIKEAFLEEAISSPLLFNDLASMEKYIAESYTGRSLVELLQNADDAKAKRFYVEKIDRNVYIVANDGNPFSEEDMWALCRSGASTKKRKSTSIGFRGIGFKSVVNYAERVHLYSGTISATFSRVETKKMIKGAGDVPIIRIPHAFQGEKYIHSINHLLQDGYNTVFIFETRNEVLSNEVSDFEGSALLFLKNVNACSFKGDIDKSYNTKRIQLDEVFTEFSCFDLQKETSWLICKSSNDECSIAFSFDGEKVVEATKTDAVIHSFLPTKTALSLPIKINGDFSTDPSRTKVVLDDDSYEAASKCASLISGVISRIVEEGADKYGIVEIIKKIAVDPLSKIRDENINDVFINKIIELLRKELSGIIGDNNSVYLQPDVLGKDDYVKVCDSLSIVDFGKDRDYKIPGIIMLLQAIGYKEIPMDMYLSAASRVLLTEPTRAKVLAEAIKKDKFSIDKDLQDKIRQAKLISLNSGVKAINEINESDIVMPLFDESVIESVGAVSEYVSYMKSIGISKEQLPAIKSGTTLNSHRILGKTVLPEVKSFSQKKAVKKWRSVEQNVAAVLEQMDDVVEVVDVSAQNVGYDLEATFLGGEKRYYEVKSVKSLGENFSFTNNEYTSASQLKELYFLAIAAQDDNSISICFIADPVNSLEMIKRAVRWEWICDEYKGEVVVAEIESE